MNKLSEQEIESVINDESVIKEENNVVSDSSSDDHPERASIRINIFL